jgi:Abortive infection C-terminus
VFYLYHGGGASISEIREPRTSPEAWEKIRATASRLMVARRDEAAGALLTKYPFEYVDATNDFGDEFSILRAVISMDQYVALETARLDKTIEHPFQTIAKTVTELSPQYPRVRFVVVQLDTEHDRGLHVPPPSPKITSEAVESALADAELLVRSRGPASAVDRVHTAVHGYLRAALERAGVVAAPQASATDLFRQLREKEPRLLSMAQSDESARRLVMALASIVDAANTLRNTASAAHPASQLLEPAEAMLVVNAARSLIHYLDRKLGDA